MTREVGTGFPPDKREAFARRSCSNKDIEWIECDDDSKKRHRTLESHNGTDRHDETMIGETRELCVNPGGGVSRAIRRRAAGGACGESGQVDQCRRRSF